MSNVSGSNGFKSNNTGNAPSAQGIKLHCNGKKTPQILRTTDYGIFRRMEGNREVTAKRASHIRQSIETIGLIPVPIVVNEHMEIIDGQGRFEAIKSLGLPVFYIVVPGLSLSDCVSMNVNTTPWNLIDYISSYAEVGNENYRRLKRLIDGYDLPMSAVVCAATGVMSTSNNKAIKDGTLILDEDFYWAVDEMLAYVERFSKPMKENRISTKGPVYNALCYCYQCDAIDNERMLEQFSRYCSKLNNVSAKTLDIFDALTEIYNFGRRSNRVYIRTSYQEWLDKKYPWYASYWGKRLGGSVVR